jgi:ribosomal protein S18 acetylase RimI-like enzyme
MDHPDFDAADVSFAVAAATDAPQIAALVNACYRGEESRRGWTTEADLLEGTRTDDQEVRALIASRDSVILKCLTGARLIASVHLQKRDAAASLGMLVVRPDRQARGVGKRLMHAAEAYAARQWRCTTMTLCVISVRSELIAFYERRGYRRTGRREPFEPAGSHGRAKVGGMEFEVFEKTIGPA